MPLRPTELFESTSFGFEQPVDTVSFFNDMMVPTVNSFDPVEQVRQSSEDSREFGEEINDQIEQDRKRKIKIFEDLKSEDNILTPQVISQPSQPSQTTVGNFKVFDGSRDQISGFRSRIGDRKVSLDFNAAANKSASGIEIVVPRDATEEEKEAAREWVQRTHDFYKANNIDIPIRRGDGLKIGGGKTGVIHTEPFFADADKAARDLIAVKGGEYARILSETLGKIDGVTFIAPHEVRGQGAESGGISERQFAIDSILPNLSALERSTSTSKINRGAFAFDREARTIRGKLIEYSPPSSDANDREIAGFGNITNPEQFKQLKSLLDQGLETDARDLAKSFLAERGEPFTQNIQDDKVAGVINGVVHHRGENGFRQVLSNLELGKPEDIEKIAKRNNFEKRWIFARAKQERVNERAVWKSKGSRGTLENFRVRRRQQLGGSVTVGSLGKLPKGLHNRWVKEARELS